MLKLFLFACNGPSMLKHARDFVSSAVHCWTKGFSQLVYLPILYRHANCIGKIVVVLVAQITLLPVLRYIPLVASYDTREKRWGGFVKPRVPVIIPATATFKPEQSIATMLLWNRNKHALLKSYIADQGKHDNSKSFRSSAGTDPKIINDLSKIFGDSDHQIIKTTVKRSSEYVESSHDTKPPTLIMESHNHTQDYNGTARIDHSLEEHGHNMHPPVLSSKEHEHSHDDNHSADHKVTHDHSHHDHVGESEKPLKITKKSIDWSDYFGIDKRLQKSVSFVNKLNEDRLKKQYFDTFNKEVIYPLNSFRQHNFAKRNYVQAKPTKETENQMNQIQTPAISDEKRSSSSDNESKLDSIDKKLRNMEGLIVDEALHYSNIGEELDSKEEQEMKEKLLSRLAAAYSLEKMRKALKDFKQSLQLQRNSAGMRSTPDQAEAKDKRVAIKKEKVILSNEIPTLANSNEKNEDFEDEQGAGHYLNGKIEEQLSEGYMGGSGRHRIPVMSTASSSGACPVLAKIVQRCRGVDLLAGDRGQLFLPLCSLHQICYLCGEAPPTTCDLVFLSEADSTCEGDMSCQRAARSALMALRELHDNLADELDGECEASPCLHATLKLNLGWQRALQR
ncbi:jg13148 [Pararge aegeria aegeria]|uniref:Jg13148 protein n=1 Tax=Pararge aegeria aegeria TaxID=348720 RepID=A0A8S4RRY4_9NEOP|nr:jg13148 [Pararge aegeria aegeria]